MQLPTRLCNYAAGAAMALGLLGRGRLFGWFAENAATTFAQAGPLLVHAGGNTVHARDFRCTKPENIAGAKPALIVLGKCVARRRQQCQTKSQPRCGLEIANREQINWHSRPPWIDRRCGRPPRRLTAFESIHDCIDVNANASRVSTTLEPKFCIGEHSAIATSPDVEPLAAGRALRPPRIALGLPTVPRALRSQSD
jgi:hypothetical protein